MRHYLLVGLVACLAVPALSAESPAAFSAKPAVGGAGGKVTVSFALSGQADVEVAILDAKGAVVRHLAAGVLGAANPPPAPLKPGLAQSLEWDGKDDYGQPVAGASVRVRAGMGAKLDRIVGGDPYAFYSKEMAQGDHAAWRLTGIEAKPDGTVYVLGNANNWGPAVLRAYTAAGEYLRTVYPPPAGRKPDEVRGWGIIEKPDGTYTFQYNDLREPALSRTLICGPGGKIARLLPSDAGDELLLESDFRLMKIRTDGTIAANPALAGQVVNEPPIGDKDARVTGPMQVAMSPDRKSFYLAGVYAASGDGRSRTGAKQTGPWRDGQVYKVDAATRKAEIFFSLPEKDVIADLNARGKSPIADFLYGTYAALQGVAVDDEGRVFVCDRQNKRVLVLDAGGKILREIPVVHPDAVAVHPKTKALYVTTRTGHFGGRGELKLLKFADWSKDTAPSATLPLCPVQAYDQATCLRMAGKGADTYLWVAYTALPVRVYRDKGAELELVKDFYEAGPQRALDLQHFVVDPKTDSIYIPDGFSTCCFRLADWKDPKFTRLMQDEKTPLRALSLAVDTRNRFLYGHADRSPVARYRLDGEFLTPAPIGGVNAFTPQLTNAWAIGQGMSDRGLAAAPDGSVVTMDALGTGPTYGGYLRFFRADPARAPWGEGLLFKSFGESVHSGGARFDLRGNLYAGKLDGRVKDPPKGFEKDENFAQSTGRIFKFAAAGPLGDLFPKEPEAPTKVYDVHYGVIATRFTRIPWFGVDGWGRIYYPTSLLPQVSVIDNEGNPVLRFGTYGNRDSAGGLAGDLVPTKDVPMAWPNSVDATDDYIYVSDIVNIRLLRLAKTFAAAETVGIK
ncbi:MAG TPA: hypothetical protein PK280_06865 [Planctomycetota bacterium]|nr:hypothetical protein [Planctomycetota bacterium]